MATRWRHKQETATTVAGEIIPRNLVVRDKNRLRCAAEGGSSDLMMAVTAETGSGDPRISVTAEAGSGDPRISVTAEAGSGDPRMVVITEAGSGVPRMAVITEAGSGDPRMAVITEAGSGDPRISVTAEAGSGDPRMDVTAEAGNGDPRMAVTAEAGSGVPRMAVITEAGSGVPRMAVITEAGSGVPRMAVITEAGSGVPRMDVITEAGSGVPRMAVTGDRRPQVGNCGHTSAAYNQSLLTDDKQNLKKIKEARNRQPEAYQHSFPCGRSRELLTKDSGNSRLGAGSTHSEASQLSPRYTRHAISSSGKSTLQSESRSSESVGARLSAFHPVSHKSPITSPRRTDSEMSDSAQGRNKNRNMVSANKTPVKYSSTCTKQLAHEKIENKEIKLASKLSESQAMHKLSTSGRLYNRQSGETKTIVVGLSRNEHDGGRSDSPVLSKKKIRIVPQQNVASSFNRTCTQATHLSKDSSTEQLLPHYNSKPWNRTTVSREQIHEKNKDEFFGDLKHMKSAMSSTPSVRRKARTKMECRPLMSSKISLQGSFSGEQAFDNKESPQNVQEFAKKHASNDNESPQAFQKFSKGHVSGRNKSPQNIQESPNKHGCYGNESPQTSHKFSRGHVSGRNKSPHNIQEILHKEHDNSAPYCETDSSLETSASRSLSGVQNAINTEIILKTNASDANMKVCLAAGEEACLVTVCKLVRKPSDHSTEVICKLPDNSDARFLQLGFQNENMQDNSRKLESCNFGSKKHEILVIDKSRASVMIQSNLCDNKEGNRNEELLCDVNRDNNICHGQDSMNSKAENSCQRLSSNKDKNLRQISENDAAKVCVLSLDMEIDDAKFQNGCPEQQRDNNKVQNVCPELESDNNKVQNVCPELESDNNKVQNVCLELESDNKKVQNVCPELESGNNKVQNVCPELESDNKKVQNVCPELESDNKKVQNVCPELESDNKKVQNVCQEQQCVNSKVQNIYLELKGDAKFQNANSKFQIACQELEADNIKFQNVCQELYRDRTEFQNSNSKFQNSNSKFQNLGLELGAEVNTENSCQENDTALRIQGLWQQLKSKKDPSNQPGVDFSVWKRTGLVNKILDKAELNRESLSPLMPQLDEDCAGIMSPLDFRVLNFPTRDFGIPQGREEENDFYDEKLEKALKESEQLLDELRMLTGNSMDLLLSPCAGSREEGEEVAPGVHRRVDGCK